MANNTIQIKRSTTVASPPSLANGELAYTTAGHVLFIGDPATVNTPIAIGGKRFPGILTANQALVANSSSQIDIINTANAIIGKIIIESLTVYVLACLQLCFK